MIEELHANTNNSGAEVEIQPNQRNNESSKMCSTSSLREEDIESGRRQLERQVVLMEPMYIFFLLVETISPVLLLLGLLLGLLCALVFLLYQFCIFLQIVKMYI